MEDSHRVKVQNAYYDQEKDLIIWDLYFLSNGTYQSFCWPSTDLLESLGITNLENVEPDHLHKFCKDMLGKEINFVIQGTPQYEPPQNTYEQYREITDKIEEHFENFKDSVE